MARRGDVMHYTPGLCKTEKPGYWVVGPARASRLVQLSVRRAVNRSMAPRIMTLKGTVIRSSLSSAIPCSTECGTWLGHISTRPFSAGTTIKSEFRSFFWKYCGSRFFVNLRDDANKVPPQLTGVFM